MEPAIVQPVKTSQRTVIVDILRGWAILGVVIGNYTSFFDNGHPINHAPNIISTILTLTDRYFFAGKSWTLLSVLFGYGFAILMNNVAAKGKNPVLFFCNRMFWLFVLAFINSAFWFGDILKDYAFLGLILLLFHGRSAKLSFRVAIVLLLIAPFVSAYVAYAMPYDYKKSFYPLLSLYYSHNWVDIFKMNLKGTYLTEMINPQYAISVHIMMFACMLLGFTAQRIDFFNRLPEFKKQLKIAFWSFLAAAIILNIILITADNVQATFIKYIKLRNWSVLSTMLAILAGICWLYINGKLKHFFNGLQAMGKMTLTNYMTQGILATLIFLNVGLGIFNTQPYWFYILIAVLVFTIQIFISKWWLTRYNYGPMEWIWRQLSYGKRLPIKKQKAEVKN
jgi:uncharacterized protein